MLTDPLIERVRGATRVEREYSFFLDLGGTTVQGVIDLVFRDAEGSGVVVDYKSNDLAGPGRLATLTELYRPQIELYALAAKRAGLVEPNEGTLYFLNKSQPVSTTGRCGASRSGRRARGGARCRALRGRRGIRSLARSVVAAATGSAGICEVGKRFEE